MHHGGRGDPGDCPKAATDAKGILDKRQNDIDKAVLEEGADKVAGRASQAALRWDPTDCAVGAERCRLFTPEPSSIPGLEVK